MRVGDIKIEAIKLMFANYSFDIDIEDLQTMVADENYGSYIVNMNGAISRALDRIENACVLPIKKKEITAKDCSEDKHFIIYNLNNLEDLFLIDRVTARYSNGKYDGNVSYVIEGDSILLEEKTAIYTILYYPTIKTVDEKVLDTDEIWIPDRIARLIPYFVKGDLYQEEEPGLAADARNIFEASLDDLKNQNQNKQNYIHQVYRIY